MTTFLIFISCIPRFEVLVEEEVVALVGARKITRQHGGLECRVTLQELWVLCHDLRVAASIRVRVGKVHAPNFDALQQGLGRLALTAYLERDVLPRVSAQSTRSALYHTQAIEERVRGFFADRAQVNGKTRNAYVQRATVPDDAPLVYVRVVHDAATISIDVTGEGLYRRGTRPQIYRAPLRETYAAAALRASGLADSKLLVDPTCGSGVFLIERATLGGGFVLPRRFAFEGWASHAKEAYTLWCQERGRFVPPPNLQLLGGDRSQQAIRIAQQNIDALGLTEQTLLRCEDARVVLEQLPPHADVIANPPWGKRLEGSNALGYIFGDWLRARSARATGRVCVLVTGHEFLRASAVRWEEMLRFNDEGTSVRLMIARV